MISLRTIAKFSLAAAIVSLLIWFDVITLEPIQAILGAPGTVGLVFALIYLTLPVSALRWYLLLRSQGVRIRFVSVYHINAIGNFASIFMPGAASGDALRLLYVLQEAGAGHRARATLTVAVDRATGLLGLGIVAILALAYRIQGIDANPTLVGLFPVLLLVCGASVAMGVAGVAICHGLAGHPWALGLEEKGRVGKITLRLIEAGAAYRHHIGALLAVILLAAVTQGLVMAAVLAVASASASGPLGLEDYAVATPIALVANVLPFTPGGLGLGESAFAKVCAMMDETGATGAGSIFLTFRALTSLVLLTGSISLAVFRKQASLRQ
jgi:uncharacterized membrane protein YbhN (UPF0104 family)